MGFCVSLLSFLLEASRYLRERICDKENLSHIGCRFIGLAKEGTRNENESTYYFHILDML